MGISSALHLRDRVYLVAAGRGAVSQYLAAGLRCKELKSISLTHPHADHICDCRNFFLLPGFGVNDSFDGSPARSNCTGAAVAGAPPDRRARAPVRSRSPLPPHARPAAWCGMAWNIRPTRRERGM